MSFICGFCHETQPPGTPLEMVVIEIRQRKEGRVKMISPFSADYVRPTQIVREVPACPSCAEKQRRIKPKVVSTTLKGG